MTIYVDEHLFEENKQYKSCNIEFDPWGSAYDGLKFRSIEEFKAKIIKDTAEKLKQAIVDNTYPYFDKDGKAVNIWKATTGFDSIDEILKEIMEVKK